jgi:hypothetical protein
MLKKEEMPLYFTASRKLQFKCVPSAFVYLGKTEVVFISCWKIADPALVFINSFAFFMKLKGTGHVESNDVK